MKKELFNQIESCLSNVEAGLFVLLDFQNTDEAKQLEEPDLKYLKKAIDIASEAKAELSELLSCIEVGLPHHFKEVDFG